MHPFVEAGGERYDIIGDVTVDNEVKFLEEVIRVDDGEYNRSVIRRFNLDVGKRSANMPLKVSPDENGNVYYGDEGMLEEGYEHVTDARSVKILVKKGEE